MDEAEKKAKAALDLVEITAESQRRCEENPKLSGEGSILSVLLTEICKMKVEMEDLKHRVEQLESYHGSC